MPDVGNTAPQFTLVDTDRNTRSLSEFLGKKTLIAFFPGAFTGVCAKEMCTFRDALSMMNSMDAQVVAISVDGPFANKAFTDANKLNFPVLSDFTKQTSKEYGVQITSFAGMDGYVTAQRSVFILDAKGTIAYKWIAENPGIEPNYDELKDALAKI